MVFFNAGEPESVELEDDQDASTFLSIGDLMSSLLMFFALLFITALVQLQEYKEQAQEQRQIFIGTLIEQLNGNNVDVTVNQETGDVSVRASILFDKGSAELKPEGQAFLRQFIPVYSGVIFSKPLFEEQIARVIIEGHTSSEGTYEQNLQLSLQRSLAVSQYIFSQPFTFSTKPRLSQRIMAAGRGEIESDQTRDNPGDRKVVFRFQFKGEEFAEWYRQHRSLQQKQ